MIRLKPPQWTVFGCDSRFRILVAGRRFGKTYLAMVELCRSAWAAGRLAWYVAPTYKQAKRIVWKPLKQMTRPYWRQSLMKPISGSNWSAVAPSAFVVPITTIHYAATDWTS